MILANADLIPCAGPGLVDPDIQVALFGDGLKIEPIGPPVGDGARCIRIHHDQCIRVGQFRLFDQRRDSICGLMDDIGGGSEHPMDRRADKEPACRRNLAA